MKWTVISPKNRKVPTTESKSVPEQWFMTMRPIGIGEKAQWNHAHSEGSSQIDSEKDIDNDGLTLLDEARMVSSLQHDGNPTVPDVFVEVDHMKGHDMSLEAKQAVIDSFGTRGAYDNGLSIALHLDYCGHVMGGWDGDIPYKEYFPESDWNDIRNKNGYYSTHFDSSRHGKFHYCIIGYHGWLTDKKWWWYSFYHFGQGEINGDSFLIFDKDNKDYASNDDAKIAAVFMHELGHNLGLDHCSHSKCSMREPSPEDSDGYCSDCWNDIDVASSF